MQSVALKGFPLSLQQTHLWSLRRESLVYYIQYAVKLEGELDIVLFQQAFQQVINRHAILRTTFQYLPDMEVPVQVILDHVEGFCPLINLKGMPDADQASLCDAYFVDLQQRPFDQEHASPLQAMLLQMAEQQHVLLLRLPALCADAYTVKNLLSDIHHSTCSFLDRTTLADEPLQYMDISAWQDDLLQEEGAEEQIAFWHKNDLSSLDALRLPFERVTGTKVGEQGAFAPRRLTIPLGAKLQGLLQEVSQRFAVSLETLLFSCWQTLLWRLTDAPPLLGFTCDGRPYEELNGTLGLYSRVVPVSTALSPALPFDRLLPLVQSALQEATERQAYFSWPATSEEATFFPLSFAFESWPEVLEMGALRCALLRRAGYVEPFALHLSALQVGSQLQLEVHFDAARLMDSLVQQLVALLPAWLEQVCEQPQGCLSSFPLLSVSQQEEMRRLSQGPRQVINTPSLHDCFSAQARQYPEAPAVRCGGQHLSYQDLERRSNQLAHLLCQRGVGANMVVAICLPRSLEQVVALLAVHKAGGAYAPLDPEHPSARLCWQLRDLKAHLLLTEESLAPLFADWDGPVMCVEQMDLKTLPGTALERRVEAEDLAYVIYTSGSTGQPKGVRVSHLGVSNYIQAVCSQLGVEAGWHFGAASTLAADLGNTSIFCALASGGCLHVLPYETLTSAQKLHVYLQTHPLDVLKIVPSHLSALLSQQQGLRLLPQRYLLLGGERLPGQLLRRLEQEESTCCLLNHYGPTEATIGVLTNVLGEARQAVREIRAESVPLGRPLANLEVYLLDRYLHLLPLGVVGEMYIGGTGLAQGYEGKAEQTGERFVPHGWSEETGKRMYRTGDLGRMGVEGQIEYMGRRDSQVKVRGYRVELGEVEAVLQGHPDVWDGVVVVREDGPEQARLVAYVVAKPQAALTGTTLRAFMAEHLPSYMLPAAFVCMEKLPLTSNGKLDWRHLPAPERNETDVSATYSMPRTPIEEILAGILANILGIEQVGIHDNFFKLGGHSLLAMQVISRICTVLQVDLPILSIFEAPTVAALALQVEQALSSKQTRIVPALVSGSRTRELPLSFAQQRLWFLDQLEPGSTTYTIPIAVSLHGALSTNALEQALGEIIKRHETLRTTFQIYKEQPVQVIAAVKAFSLPIVNLSTVAIERQEEEKRRIVREETQQPFDLAHGPLLRATLLYLREDEHVFLMTLHHIISDGWSRSVLLQELTALYSAFMAGQPSPLPALPIQYADYALWQRGWLQGEVLEEQMDYWQGQLADLAPLELPIDHPRPAVLTTRGASQAVLVPPEVCEELRELSQREGVTLFMSLLAAFQVLLARYSGQSDIAVGTPIANRTQSEIEGLIGFFVNTLVLRSDLSGDPTFCILLAQVREMCLGAYAHQDLPFEKLVEVLQPERDQSRPPLFQVAMSLQQAAWLQQVPQSLPQLTISGLPEESTRSKFELNFALTETAAGLQCEMEYSSDLFEGSTIARLLSHWQRLLQAIVAQPEGRLSSFDLLTTDERYLLLEQWGPRRYEYPVTSSLPERFEQQVAVAGDAIALVWQDQQLSYQALNVRAERVAQVLREQGVRAEVVVGLWVERSLELLIGLLAIEKAGGAYLPIDPATPEQRRAFLLEDARAKVLLTHSHLFDQEEFVPVGVRVLCLDQVLATSPDHLLHNALEYPDPQQAAYVLYTSGSTGRPKGVIVSHANVLRLFVGTERELGIGKGQVWSGFHSVAFDFSVWEIWGAWLSGGRLWLVSYEVSRAPDVFVEQVREQGVTVLSQTPSAFRQFMWAQESRKEEGQVGVRWVIFGGEALEQESVQEWMRRHRGELVLVNMYGITETTVHVTVHQVEEREVKGAARGSAIGRGLGDLDLYVLDERGKPVPIGVEGELYVGGGGLARGYVGRGELTAERFVPHGFSHKGGERLYRTGDRVRYGELGELEYLGRRDEQVKVRGYRIELGEIEGVLQMHPEVRECVVVVREEVGGDKRLVGYVVGKGERELAGAELRAYLHGQMPEHLVPSFIEVLPALPLTANGKLDRRALPAPTAVADVQEQHEEGAVGPLEELVAGVWKEVLRVDHVGIRENFFAVGGHSLLATQLISRLRTVTQIGLPLRSLFESPTVAGLAKQLEQALRRGQTGERPLLQSVAREQDLPLSFAQQRLWFLDQFEPASATYNIPLAVCLHGSLDLGALVRSMREVTRRHESLRTTFQLKEDQPVQILASSDTCCLVCVDLTGLLPLRQEREQRVLQQQEARAPFDLARGPLLRVTVIRVLLHEHLLLLTMHHIISDGWSLQVFIRELTALYSAFVAGQPSPLPALPIQYADYALWQRGWLQGEVLEEQMAYWQQHLADLAPLELPIDHPRPAVLTTRGASQAVLVPPEVCEELRELSQREGVTLFMSLLAAFQVLLARCSGQSDIAVGTPIANRTQSEIEGLIGFFVNTLVLRSDLAGDPTFCALLAQVREVCLGAYAHQDLPFEKLVEVLQPERDQSRPPLFQVAMSLQQAAWLQQGPQSLPQLTISGLPEESTRSKFELNFTLTETAAGLQCEMEYSSDLFEASAIARLLSHWQRLLQAIVADPGQHVATLPLLSKEELQRQLVDWNATRVDFSDPPMLHQLVEAQVRRTPDRLALTFGDEQLSFARLDHDADVLALHLRTLGVGPDVLVGVCIQRSLDLVIGLLAILKAGGAYLPLDPTYPQERLAFMLDDSQAGILLTHSTLRTLFPVYSGQLLCLDSERPTASPSLAAQALSSEVSIDHLAYMIYTSGSTGYPKGVMVAHKAICNRLHWMQARFHFSVSERLLLKTPINFDASIWELFSPLAAGAHLVIAPPNLHQYSIELVHLIAQYQITTIQLVPSMLRLVLQEPDLVDCRCLQRVFCGGEVLPLELRDRFFASLSASLVNLYGPTEAAIDVASWTCDEHREEKRVPIGYPISNIKLYLLDAHRQPVPIGVAGELYIGGIGLARGYWRRAALTAEKFVPNPYSQQEGTRLYRTGDLARYQEDGSIEYLGRRDEQVKLRGFRVELGEIEGVLQRHPDVRESVVVMREQAGGDRRLVGYVVGRGERELSGAELRTYLRGQVPEYLVPAFIEVLPALPLTPNGKLDRRALPEPGGTRSTEQGNAQFPRTPIEEMVAVIWRDLLGLEYVGIHENFFEVGGHSLLATQLISRLRTLLQVELPLRSLFEFPTVAGLAESVEQALRQGQALQRPALQPAVRTHTLPLSFAQQRLWFLDQLEPESLAYTVPLPVRLQGRLDRAALEQSLNEVVRRHESLRTTFQLQDDQPVQVIGSVNACALLLIDLTGLEPAERERQGQQLYRQDVSHPFDLVQGPLLRRTLVRLSQQEHLLLLTLHHIIADGWSINVLSKEITTLYRALSTGQVSPLPDLPVQYADFALWQRTWLQGEVLEEQMRYWQEQLADLAALELPTDFPRPVVQSNHGAYMSLLLPAELLAELKHLGRREGVTLFMILLAAFQWLLSCYSGQDDVAIGTDIANRTLAETEGLIGFFVNTLVLRTDLADNPTFCDLLARVREVCLGAYTHQDLPFEKLVEVLQPERDLSRSPLFQVFLSLQQEARPVADETIDELTLSNLAVATTAVKFDLHFGLSETEHGLSCVMQYNTDLFEAETISRLLRHFQTLLAAIVQQPTTPLRRLSLLSEEERHRLLVSWNATPQTHSRATSFCDLFEQQVVATPDRVGLLWQEEQWTYAQLNRRANQLALLLRQRGVGTEVLVGLYLERSPQMLLSLLAIFKAGGAYVPLDPATPSERLAFMIDEAHLSLLLTTHALHATVPTTATTVLCLEDCWSSSLASEAEAKKQAQTRTGEELAYVIYTSGSTGRPKGAMVQQAGMLNHLLCKIEALHLHENDIVAQTASHCFDISVWQFLAGLLVGGRIHIFSEEQVHDPQQIWRQVATEGTSILEVVPSLLHPLLDEWESSTQQGERWHGLRWLLVTGEAVSPRLCSRWLQHFPSIPLLNAYGPTECSDDVTHACIADAPAEWQSSVPLGYPLSNLQVYVLNGLMEPVPVGVVGEIFVGGIGVGRGYLGDPARTAATFLPDPHGQQAGGRLYRTGDWGRHQADGQLRFLGRIDEQVKVRGFRIELGEINAVLQSHEQVGACEVIAWQRDLGDQRLVAYVVGREGEQPLATDLRSYLRGKLPEYMQPSLFVALEALPLTANGKVDRRKLPSPESMPEEVAEESVRVANPVEDIVTAIWKEVLGLEEVHREENFFAQGGHSLLATQVVARLRAILKVELPLRTLFESPSIVEISGQIERALRQQQGLPMPPLQAVSRAQRLPLSFAQQRLWFMDRLQPGNAAYTIANAVRLRGKLDLRALERSFEELVQRHESLRTTFRLEDDQPIQVIAQVVGIAFPLIDLSGLMAEQREEEAQRLTRQETQRPFDLSHGPLLRTTLLLLAGNEYVLLLSMHHIISDGWSMGVFVRELSSLYRAFVAGQFSPLPALPLQYADFAFWQRQWLQGNVLAAHLDYWTRQLRGITPLNLPSDRPRPVVQSYRGASYAFRFSASLSNDLVALSRQEGVTLFMTLLTAFQTLLYRYTAQTDIVVGTDIANRTQVETENLIGFFVNLLVLRTDLSKTPSFRAVLHRVHEMLLGAYTHQDMPFEMLVEKLQPGQVTDRMPLVQVLFVLQNVPTSRAKGLPGVTLSDLASETTTAKFDIALFMQESATGLHGDVIYNTDLFDPATIATLVHRFEALLRSVIAHPDMPVNTLDISIEAEKEHRQQRMTAQRQMLSMSRGERIDVE